MTDGIELDQGKAWTTLQNVKCTIAAKENPKPDLHGREVLVPEALAVTRLMGILKKARVEVAKHDSMGPGAAGTTRLQGSRGNVHTTIRHPPST